MPGIYWRILYDSHRRAMGIGKASLRHSLGSAIERRLRPVGVVRLRSEYASDRVSIDFGRSNRKRNGPLSGSLMRLSIDLLACAVLTADDVHRTDTAVGEVHSARDIEHFLPRHASSRGRTPEQQAFRPGLSSGTKLWRRMSWKPSCRSLSATALWQLQLLLQRPPRSSGPVHRNTHGR